MRHLRGWENARNGIAMKYNNLTSSSAMAETARRMLLCVTFKLNLTLKGNVSANIYGPLDGEWLYYNLAAGSFHTTKLFSRLYLIEMEFYFKKTKHHFLSYPLGIWR